jgi:hypothetical protein
MTILIGSEKLIEGMLNKSKYKITTNLKRVNTMMNFCLPSNLLGEVCVDGEFSKDIKPMPF